MTLKQIITVNKNVNAVFSKKVKNIISVFKKEVLAFGLYEMEDEVHPFCIIDEELKNATNEQNYLGIETEYEKEEEYWLKKAVNKLR